MLEQVVGGTDQCPFASEDVFRTQGVEIARVGFPDVTRTVADRASNNPVEAAVAHEATYPGRRDGYGPVLAMVIEAGGALTGTEYQKILLQRLDQRGYVAALFETVDLLLTPVHPFAPLTLATVRTLGEQPELIAKLQRHTCPFDMTGHPTLTLPGGFSRDGLPIGLQRVAAHPGKATLIRAGNAFRAVTSWHRRRPLA